MKRIKQLYSLCFYYYLFMLKKYRGVSFSQSHILNITYGLTFFTIFGFMFFSFIELFIVGLLLTRYFEITISKPFFYLPAFVYFIPFVMIIIILFISEKFNSKLSKNYEIINEEYQNHIDFKRGRRIVILSILIFFSLFILIYILVNQLMKM